MKIGWLVWKYPDTENPELYKHEPDGWVFNYMQIVYAEVET